MSSGQGLSNIDKTIQPVQAQTRIATGATTVQTAATATQETVVKSEGQTVVSHEQHIASELPVTQQKVITQEFVPVIHEKVITTVPIVTEEKVTTGHSIAGGTQTTQLGQQYLAGTRAEVELQAHMTTGIPEQQYQQTMVTQVPVTTARVEKDIIPVEVERMRYETQTVPVEVTTTTTQAGLLNQGLSTGFAGQSAGFVGQSTGFVGQPTGFVGQQQQPGFISQPGLTGVGAQQQKSGIGATLGAEIHAGAHQLGGAIGAGAGKAGAQQGLAGAQQGLIGATQAGLGQAGLQKKF